MSEILHSEAVHWLLELEPALRKQCWIVGRFDEDCFQFLREKIYFELLALNADEAQFHATSSSNWRIDPA